MKTVIRRVFKMFCWAMFLLLALLLIRYMPVDRCIQIDDEYEVLVYRDKFDLAFNPGGGSDSRGFCVVRDRRGRCSASAYYLGMLWFASDLTGDHVSVENGKVVVLDAHFLPLDENIWRLIFLY